MFPFKRNVGTMQRVIRIVAGALLIGGGVLSFNGQAAGYALAAMGAMGLLTGLMGYCPACAMVGGKSAQTH